MVNLYIYYQVREEHAPTLVPRLQAMQAALAQRHGVAGRLMRRPQASDGVQTWMEIYESTGPGFDTALAAAFDQAGLAPLIAGPRHTEVFTEISPCA